MPRRYQANRSWPVLLTLALIFIGCDRAAAPYREVAREQHQNVRDLIILLRPITDLDSLKAKKPQLAELYQRLEATKAKGESLNPPTLAIKDKIKEENDQLTEVYQTFFAELKRVRELPGANEIFDEVANMSAKLRTPMNSP